MAFHHARQLGKSDICLFPFNPCDLKPYQSSTQHRVSTPPRNVHSQAWTENNLPNIRVHSSSLPETSTQLCWCKAARTRAEHQHTSQKNNNRAQHARSHTQQMKSQRFTDLVPIARIQSFGTPTTSAAESTHSRSPNLEKQARDRRLARWLIFGGTTSCSFPAA